MAVEMVSDRDLVVLEGWCDEAYAEEVVVGGLGVEIVEEPGGEIPEVDEEGEVGGGLEGRCG